MRYTKHSLDRMNSRGISHTLAQLVFDYGYASGDKIILNKKKAVERLTEARAELAAHSARLDAGAANMSERLHQLAGLETEIRNLCKLIDKQGVVLVMAEDILITAYGIH